MYSCSLTRGLSREELETEGLALARSIATLFTDRFHEKYAEHPYINATIDDVDVDLVPCYNVDSATRIQSAVDRTPFHTRYITDKINGLIDDVLLLKQFTKAGGIYGSDQMTEGFSGYLCESSCSITVDLLPSSRQRHHGGPGLLSILRTMRQKNLMNHWS